MFKLYSVFDVKATTFAAPFILQNDAIAIRSFAAAVKDPESMLSKYPEDYILYCIGTFDPDSSVIDSFAKPVHLAVASNFVQEA